MKRDNFKLINKKLKYKKIIMIIIKMNEEELKKKYKKFSKIRTLSEKKFNKIIENIKQSSNNDLKIIEKHYDLKLPGSTKKNDRLNYILEALNLKRKGKFTYSKEFLEKKKIDELKQIAKEDNIEVKTTNTSKKPTKDDYIKAITKHHEDYSSPLVVKEKKKKKVIYEPGTLIYVVEDPSITGEVTEYEYDQKDDDYVYLINFDDNEIEPLLLKSNEIKKIEVEVEQEVESEEEAEGEAEEEAEGEAEEETEAEVEQEDESEQEIEGETKRPYINEITKKELKQHIDNILIEINDDDLSSEEISIAKILNELIKKVEFYKEDESVKNYVKKIYKRYIKKQKEIEGKIDLNSEGDVEVGDDVEDVEDVEVGDVEDIEVGDDFIKTAKSLLGTECNDINEEAMEFYITNVIETIEQNKNEKSDKLISEISKTIFYFIKWIKYADDDYEMHGDNYQMYIEKYGDDYVDENVFYKYSKLGKIYNDYLQTGNSNKIEKFTDNLLKLYEEYKKGIENKVEGEIKTTHSPSSSPPPPPPPPKYINENIDNIIEEVKDIKIDDVENIIKEIHEIDLDVINVENITKQIQKCLGLAVY